MISRHEPRRPARRARRARRGPSRRGRAAASWRGREVDAALRRRSTPSSASQRRSVRQASRSTQLPIATIRPVSSASGMNSPGGTSAALGVLPAHERLERRRSRPSPRPTTRLVRGCTARRARCARRSALSVATRSRASRRIASSNTSTRGAAAVLGAVHGGVGVADAGPRARASSPRERDADAGAAGTPRRPRRGTARRTASSDALGHGARPASPATSSQQDGELVAAEARDRVGRAQRAAQPRRRRRTSRRSPAAWPRQSLTSLKRSRSTNSTATPPACGRARRSACSRRSRNSARFGSPVSESCSAWWARARLGVLALGDVARRPRRPGAGAAARVGDRCAPRSRPSAPIRPGRTTRQAPVAVAAAGHDARVSSSPTAPASSGWMNPTSAAVRPTSSSGR